MQRQSAKLRSSYGGASTYDVHGGLPDTRLVARGSAWRNWHWNVGVWDSDIEPSLGCVYYERSGAPFPDPAVAAPFLARGFIRARYIVELAGTDSDGDAVYHVRWEYDGHRDLIEDRGAVTTRAVREVAAETERIFTAAVADLPDAPWAEISAESARRLRAAGLLVDSGEVL